MSIEAGLCKYAELNDKIKQELRTKKKVTITAVNGQRYIGCALDAGKTIQVHGTPGNDMACYLNGGKVEVFGNCQDAVGNTMNGGEIVIHGHAGDAMGYGMRDGQIFVETNVACRGGIHMKEFEQMKPVLVIGRNAGSFLGEYMAGGTIVLLGLGMKRGEKLFGTHCASGMHGGKIFVRGSFPKENISPNKLHQQLVNSPFVLLGLEQRFDVIARITGGGVTGQAGALRLGISRALNAIDAEHNRPTLKKAGFLSRDARVIERKKAGLKKARKASQFSKR